MIYISEDPQEMLPSPRLLLHISCGLTTRWTQAESAAEGLRAAGHLSLGIPVDLGSTLEIWEF